MVTFEKVNLLKMEVTEKKDVQITVSECNANLSALADALYVIGGKWKLRVIIAIREGKSKRFNELQRTITGISAKVLSHELKELELNGFVKRTVYTQTPVLVEYELTDYSHTLDNVLESLITWGFQHREKIRELR